MLRVIDHGHFGRVHRAIIITAAMSGLRLGELLALRWRDVDAGASRPDRLLATA